MLSLGLAWLTLCVVAAFIVAVARFSPRLTLVELIAASFPIGTIIPAWIVYGIACFTSAIGTHTIAGATLLILYIVFEHASDFLARFPAAVKAAFGRHQRVDTLIGVSLAAAAFLFLWPLYSTRMLPEEGGKVYSGGSCWADLPIHMHMANSFLHGRNADVNWGQMHSPVFAGEYMSYPFLPDFHAAVLAALSTRTIFNSGATESPVLADANISSLENIAALREAFLWTGLPLAVAMIVLMMTFAARLTRSRLGALLAVALTVCAAGMGGIRLAQRDGYAAAATMDVAQNDITGDGKIVWFAFLPHVVLPQRGANFAYPLVLVVLTLVWRATDHSGSEGAAQSTAAAAGASKAAIAVAEASGDATRGSLDFSSRRQLLVCAAALSATLPLVQAHSFLALGVIIATVAVLDFHKWLADPRLLVAWFQAGVVAVALGYPQMRLFRHQVEVGNGGRFISLGWWYQNHDIGRPAGVAGFFKFWWMNLGPAVPLFFAALVLQFLEVLSAARLAARARAAGVDSTAVAAGTTTPGGSRQTACDAFYLKECPAPVLSIGAQKALAQRQAAANRATSGFSGAAGGTPSRRSAASPGAAAAEGERQVQLSHLEVQYQVPAEGEKDAAESEASRQARRYRLQASGPLRAVVSPVTEGREGEGGDSPTLQGNDGARLAGVALAGNALPGTSLAFGVSLKVPVRRAASSGWQGSESDLGVWGAVPGPKGTGGLNIVPPGSHFLGHLWYAFKATLKNELGVDWDLLTDLASYSWDAPDRLFGWWGNRLSLTGRGLDALKIGIGGLLVFLMGNYVNFQPWDRDNCKLFYTWLFIASAFSGAFLAAPLEALFQQGPGLGKMMAWLSLGGLRAYAAAVYLSSFSNGAAAMPDALFAPEERVLTTGAGVAPDNDQKSRAEKAAAQEARRVTRRTEAYGPATLPARFGGILGFFTVPVLLALACLSGIMMIQREFGLYHVLLDEDQFAVGEWLRANTPPKAVFVHRDVHITPAGCLAARPTLVAYNGWMWSHGYNYGDRDRDRSFIHENALKDSDPAVYGATRRWGVRYILGEWMPRHHRPAEAAYHEAVAKRAYDPSVEVPNFDPDLYLDGQVRRVYSRGRYDVLEVLGYGFPPN